jgi:hypothetical protein
MLPEYYAFDNIEFLDLLNEIYDICRSKQKYDTSWKITKFYSFLSEMDKIKFHRLLVEWSTVYYSYNDLTCFRCVVGELLTVLAPFFSQESIKLFRPYIQNLKKDLYRTVVTRANFAEIAFDLLM